MSTSPSALSRRKTAEALVAAELGLCASDVLTWRRKSVLPDDAKLREVAHLLELTYPDDSLQQAEALVIKRSLELAASCGGVSS